MDTFEHDRDSCPVLFWEPAGPGTRRRHNRRRWADRDFQRIVIFRLGLQHGFGRLAAPSQAGDSDMEAGRPPSPAQAPLSGIHTYPIYLSLLILKTYPNLSQLS